MLLQQVGLSLFWRNYKLLNYNVFNACRSVAGALRMRHTVAPPRENLTYYRYKIPTLVRLFLVC